MQANSVPKKTRLFQLSKRSVAGGYCSGSAFGARIQEALQQLCMDLKDDAVALVDVLAPPDHILQSTLGASDGQVVRVQRLQ